MNRTRWWLTVAVAVLVAAFFALDLGRWLTLESLRQAQQSMAALYADRPLTVLAVYFAVYLAVAALSLPGAVPMTLLGGALFGLGVGMLVVSFASTIGATLAMLAARYLLRDAVRARFGARLAEIDRGVSRDGAFYLFTLRLVPVVPFVVINLAIGLTAMRAWTFAWVSQLGMLAGTVVFVNAGTQLAQLSSLQGILSPTLLGAFALLGLFPWLARAAVGMVRQRRALAPWAQRRPRRFDRNLVVIGAGAAGLVTSYIAAAVKARVTLVEAHRMGGDCLNTGCVPSKALIRAASVASEARRAAEFGVDVGPVQVDFARVMDRVRRVVREVEPHDSVERYTGLGVDVRLGRARIVDPWHVEITGADGRTETLSSRAIVVATGARPIVLPLPGLREAGVLTSDTLWDLEELPRRLVILGGGPIGCELAQAFARLGSQVTVVEWAPRLMGREDEDVSVFVQARLEADGVTVLTGQRAVRCEPGLSTGEGSVLAGRARAIDAGPAQQTLPGGPHGRLPRVDPTEDDPTMQDAPWALVVDADGVERRIAFDRIVCAVGRQARLEGFGLEELGLVDPAKPTRTLPVDEHLRTRIPTILACGDVVGPYAFTHAAAHQAWTAAVNGLFGGLRAFKVDDRVIPWCTFVDPEVARVGLNVREANERGIAFELTRFELGELDRVIADRGAATSVVSHHEAVAAHADALTTTPDARKDATAAHAVRAGAEGWVQVLTVPGKDRILGATIVGHHAGDLLAEFVLAMKHGLGLNKILGTVHTYPTRSEASKYVAGQWKRAHAPQGLLRWVGRFHDWRRS